MKILVAGRSGQVAQSLGELNSSQDLEITALGRPKLDITDLASVANAVKYFNPDILINAAAYTAVDKAEDEKELAYELNAVGAQNVASAAADVGIPIIHISTDYVFDGSASEPYTETDQTSPLGVYGASKLAGEENVIETNPKHIIVRTSWVYSPFGHNFLKTMLRLAADRDEVSVVDDQFGAPTYAPDIADALIGVSQKVRAGNSQWGIYNLTNGGLGSWADFAEVIFKTSSTLEGPSAHVNRIPTSAYPTPAERPKFSKLDTTKLKNTFGLELPGWEHSVLNCIARLST